jgi:hypothetical protein
MTPRRIGLHVFAILASVDFLRTRSSVPISWFLMSRNLPSTMIALSFLLTGPLSAQESNEPANVASVRLNGVIDFHVHSGPDSFTRSILDFEIARIAKREGMRAIVLKNHFTMTADRAVLAEKISGMRCYGGIVLNRAVGGLNSEAIERMVTFSGDRARVVWLPTFDAQNHVKRFKEDRPFVAVTKDGRPVPELKRIFELCAKHNLVLCTGHSSAEECLLIITAARRAGIERILVTHAMADPIQMNLEQLKSAAKLGAKLECVWLTNLQGPKSHLPSQRNWKNVNIEDYATAMKAVGVEHFVLSSDLGQFLNPIHTDGLKAFVLGLKNAGFTQAQIDVMSKKNAAVLLGLKD